MNNEIKTTVNTAEQRDELIKQLQEMTFKRVLPKSYEELDMVSGYFSDDHKRVYQRDQIANTFSYGLFKFDKQYKKSIAMAKLSQLMYVYNDGWVADFYDKHQLKHCLVRINNTIDIDLCRDTYFFLSFKTAEIASEFLNNFEEDIKAFFEM